MKQNLKIQFGFTLIELLVVISIMMLSFAIVLVGLNQQRVKRSVGIAQNETVTTIRKVQSYMLSSRNIGANNKAVKYYILHITPGASTYTVRAVDQDYTYYNNLETVVLREGVVVENLSVVDRTGTAVPAGQCAQLIFSAPFGKIYMDTTHCDNSIINTLKNPVEMIQLTDSVMSIDLKNTQGSTLKNIIVNGFSGTVVAN